MIDISININDNKVIGNISSSSDSFDESKYDYAFYLYKDGDITDRQWYSRNLEALFNIEELSGIFYIRVFLRDIENNKVIGYNSKKISINTEAYNIDIWNKKVVKTSIEDFQKDKDILNGIYQFKFGKNVIDVLFDGFIKEYQNQEALVCFSGAISDRANKYAPFFSGLNISKKLTSPIISIADPSLAISKNLALSWYAGNENLRSLPDCIANILDMVARKMNIKLTLFGGSGGGFAALSIAQKMNEDTNVVVWNPQTSISKYLKPSVLNYLKICFPDSRNSLDDNLESIGITHNLLKSYKNSSNRFNILYLQNIGDDFHLQNHAKPFMQVLDIKKESDSYYRSKQGISFWFNNWGDGHIIPSEKVILDSLLGMLEGKDKYEIIKGFKLSNGLLS